MKTLVFTAINLADTDRLGTALAAALPGGTVMVLSGTLGAGKTRLVQAIAAACGIDRETVVSPTFVLCQQYEGSRAICHFDVYRLKDQDEFWQLGPEEYFDGPGLSIIEWGEKVTACLPRERLEIQIEPLGEESREFKLAATGAALEAALAIIARQLSHGRGP